ncbi:MAG: recombination-associated protein RdgC [Gammaproteobacteria bacterium]|nr:recombination-associated protein RdgC [Gammaproteobacteria bacterium]
MWFRNLQLYRLAQPFDLSPEQLDERLRAGEFSGCGRMDMQTSGWAPPLGRHGQQLVHAANGYIMICLRKEEKIIPAGVVRQLLEDRVAEISETEQREVYRREKLRMKETIMVDLLPRALSRISNLFAYLDVRNGLLVVDSPASTKAEMLVSQLRTTLGRFPAAPVRPRLSLSAVMTRWLSGEGLPQDFVLGEECELKHPEPDGGVVSCKHQDLTSAEVFSHIKNGKRVVRLAFQWRERLSCVIHDDLSIKRLRFEDIISEAAEESEDDDFATRFDMDFSLMTLELGGFFPVLMDALGGEVLSDSSGPDTSPQPVTQQRPTITEAEPA